MTLARKSRRPAVADELGPLLRALMSRSGMTADALAGKSGIDRAHVFKILRGDAGVRFATLEILCAAAGGHVCDLYDPALAPAEAPGRWPRK